MLDLTLRSKLLQMRQADLDLRPELAADGPLFQGYAERMAELHRRHNARLRAIITDYGWPGRSLVGEDGAAAAWLLLQHAVLAPDLTREAVTLLQRAVRLGKSSLPTLLAGGAGGHFKLGRYIDLRAAPSGGIPNNRILVSICKPSLKPTPRSDTRRTDTSSTDVWKSSTPECWRSTALTPRCCFKARGGPFR